MSSPQSHESDPISKPRLPEHLTQNEAFLALAALVVAVLVALNDKGLGFGFAIVLGVGGAACLFRSRRWSGVILIVIAAIAATVGVGAHPSPSPATQPTTVPSTTTSPAGPAFLDNLTPSKGQPDARGLISANGQQLRESVVFHLSWATNGEPRTATYDLAGQYSTFSAILSVANCNLPPDTVTFNIQVDGKSVTNTPVTNVRNVPVSVRIAGGNQLSLSADYGLDQYGACAAVFGNAKLDP